MISLRDKFYGCIVGCHIGSAMGAAAVSYTHLAQGLVLDGVPHIHFVFSDTKNTYTGHLEPGTEVLYLVEMTLAELTDCSIKRLKDENNIAYFQPND